MIRWRSKPVVASVCGTFLKPEMLSVYRQVTGLKRFRTVVFTETHLNAEQFPFEPVEELQRVKPPKPTKRGNFILRFWFKHLTKQWPPPIDIYRTIEVPDYRFDLLDRLARRSVDLIHVYYGHKAVSYREILLGTKLPYVISFHGMDVSRFIRASEEGNDQDFQRVVEQATLVLARSESLLQNLENLGVPRSKLRLNRTPIPLESLEFRVRKPAKDGKWRFVQACRLIEKKGILTIIQALKLLKASVPHFTYVLCGQGPMLETIRSAAQDAGIAENLHMPGWLSQEQLLREFRKGHLFLHPSETTAESDQEGIPNAMLEAMASGLPVVATLHGGIPEAVTHGKDGILVPERSPEALAEAIQEAMKRCPEFSENARESVVERFGKTQQIEALEDCYAEAIKLGRPRVISTKSGKGRGE